MLAALRFQSPCGRREGRPARMGLTTVKALDLEYGKLQLRAEVVMPAVRLGKTEHGEDE